MQKALLQREVEIPRHRWSVASSPLAIVIALLTLSWVSALSATALRVSRERPGVHKVRPCPERVIQRAENRRSETPRAAHECAYGELLDCNYGGRSRAP